MNDGPRRERSSPRDAACLSTLLVAMGCGGSDRQTAEADSQRCWIARGDGLSISREDAEALRREFQPPPDADAATRLVVDAFLAEWIETGNVGQASTRERIAYHNKLANKDLPDRLRALARARDALNLTYGPCFEPARKRAR